MPAPWETDAETEAAPWEKEAPAAEAAPWEKAASVQTPQFESPIAITEQGPVYRSQLQPVVEPPEPTGEEPWTAGQIVSAPVKLAGGLIATGLNLVSPTTWLPQAERERQAVSFGDPRTPAEQAEAKMFQAGQPIYRPQGTALDPEGSDMERILSQWSTPESMAMLPLGMSRAGAAVLLTQMVPSLLGNIKSVISGEGTPTEKRDRINNLFVQGLLIAHGAGKGKPGEPTEPTPVPVPVEPRPTAPARTVAEPVPPPAEPVPEPVPVEATAAPAPPAAPVGAPAAPPGERLVTVERPDGTKYLAAFGDKFWPGQVPSVAKLTSEGKWSHGATGKGEKIIEDGGQGALEPPKPAAAPAPAVAPEQGKIDDWITKLESLRAEPRPGGSPTFLDPEVFKGISVALRNTAIDVMIGVLKAGKSIGEALDAAITHIREQVKDFDETKVRAALTAYLNPPETTGIAHRVSEARGMAPERGQGVSAAESVEHGREFLQQGLDPQSVLDVFNKTQAVRADDMAVVRAHLERLSKATNDAADTQGVDSPEFKAAWEAEKDWRAKVKPMQTEWHRIGQAQQGETDINTGTFTGLQRLHQENTGTDFTPGQKKRATEIAGTNQQAQADTGKAQQTFNDHIRTRATTDAEKAALDAAHKTVREWAITRAEAENKARAADEVHKQAVEKVQADAARRAQDAATKTVRDDAVRRADAENKARAKATQRAKELADIQLKRAAKVHEAAVQRARQAAADLAAKERKLQGDPTLRVWTKAKEYLDTGLDNFDDIRQKLATDLGMSIEQVTRLLAQDKRAKYLADDLWRKQQKERTLKAQSKRWVQGLSTPALTKALQSIPRAMFVLKVGLHGTVALGTHAPTVAFQPRFWNAYVRNFGKMYHMVGSRAYYEQQVQNLLRNPNYIPANRAGLVNNPFVYEEYAMYPVAGKVAQISPQIANAINAMTGMGNRGYSVLKILRQDMFDQHWHQLPKSMQRPEIAQAIADGVNHATGVVQGRAPTGTNLALFAPRLEASRVMWLAGDPLRAVGTLLNWKNASQGEKYFAMNQLKEKLRVVGTFSSLLALNQGILSAVGSDQKVNVSDPFKPDFLKFKVAGMNITYGNPMITMARLPLRLFVGVENEGKFNKIVYEDENVATILFEYVRSQMSPFAGTTTDLAIGRDFMRRPLPRAAFGLLPGKTNIPKRLKQEGIQPYTWTEYTAQQAAMIPLQEALKEVWGKDLLMDAAARERSLKALATIIVMGGTGARVSDDYSLRQSPAVAQRAPWE